MSRGRPQPLSRTLTRMNLTVSATALLLACVVFGTYDLVTFRERLVSDLSIQAQIAGANSVSAILFNDAATAADTLASLKASPDVRSAYIYAVDGRLIASYRSDPDGPPGAPREAGQEPPPRPLIADGDEAVEFRARDVSLARRIVFDGKDSGTIVITADLTALYQRIVRYLLMIVFVLLSSLLLALMVSRVAQRATSGPLVALASVARLVSENENYAVRAAAEEGASFEVTTLVQSFNDMLERIQHRDRSLQLAREQLEERVRQRTAELNATNQELEAFSYSVSHDLRAPLRHIVGFAALLTQHAGTSLDDKGRRHLKTITDAANRMARLIDDLLAFSRMGRASLTPRPVDLNAIVREAKAEIAPDVAGREIDWTIHPLPVVYGDAALLRPVVVNLLSNAVKYTGTRPVATIEVGSVAGEGETVVYVRDNGVGFDMQYAGKLFGVFQRLHRADEFGGTGIGLANVRRIINRHGGRTWAEAEPDRGATFYFSLPSAPPEANS